MESRRDYNVIAIGAGATGLITTAAVAGLGGRAALIERNKMGGDCLNSGCVPSKGLISSARLIQKMRGAERWGLDTNDPQFDLQKIFASMRTRRGVIEPNDSQERYESLGVEVHRGDARFISPHEVEVNGTVLRAKNIVISAGSRAMVPPVKGIDSIPYYTNENIFDHLDRTPRSLLVLGGGPIGCELGQVFQRLGVQVTICEYYPQILIREDPEVSDLLRKRLEAEGVRILTGVKCLETMKRTDGGVAMKIEPVDSSSGPPPMLLDADAMLVAAGRVPNVEDLDLEAAGVDYSGRGVNVNGFMQTSQPHIFAGGDIVGGYQFTHVADHHARVIVENIIRGMIPPLRWIGRLTKADTTVLPWCTFTGPEVARVGLNEIEARKAGVEHTVFKVELAHVDRCILEREDEGFVKVIAHPKTGRILGATIVGEGAGELIHEFTLAMKHGITLGQVAATIHAYPTHSEAVRRAGDAFNRTRLTPGKKKFLTGLFRRNLP